MDKAFQYLRTYLIVGFSVFLSVSSMPQAHAATQELSLGTKVGASLNWSGYVSTSGTYTGVSSSWIVPYVTPDATVSQGKAQAQWVGIGGVQSNDLIQAGTQALSFGNTVVYQAWYEVLPDFSTPVDLAVKPGDSITTSILYVSGDEWLVTIRNNTTNSQYDTLLANHSSFSSAEWIQERVSTQDGRYVPLSQFGNISFSNAGATVNGQYLSIQNLPVLPLFMVNQTGSVLAHVSRLDTQGNFTVAQQQLQTAVLSNTPIDTEQSQIITVTVGFDAVQSPATSTAVSYFMPIQKTFTQNGIRVHKKYLFNPPQSAR